MSQEGGGVKRESILWELTKEEASPMGCESNTEPCQLRGAGAAYTV
nr:hypothetical protein [uncultured Solibaculum sp.]